MQGLFGSHDNVRRAGSSGLFRSNTNANLAHSSSGLTNGCCEDDCQCSDSECGSSGPSIRRIALAKKVLAEATRTFSPCLSISAHKADMCKNTGAIGPLMSMIQSECDDHALHCCLDTLSFLLLDKANRKVVHDLGGLSLLMSIFTRQTEWALLRVALNCVCSLIKTDDLEKEKVWLHLGKQGILGLLNAHASAPHLLEVLCHIRKIAFTGKPHGTLTLLEPQLLVCSANLLTRQHQPHVVVAKVCKFLRWCAEAAEDDHTQLWASVLPQITPLLRDPMTVEPALAVLLSLSEHTALKPVFADVHVVPVLVSLLAHPTKGISVTASCIISALAEQSGPCLDQMCTETVIKHMLRALSMSEQHADVSVAVLYTLNRLVQWRSAQAVPLLNQREAPRIIIKCVRHWTDTAMIMGAMQLIEAMGLDPEALFVSAAPTPLNERSLSGEVSVTSLAVASQHTQLMSAGSDFTRMSVSSALSLLPECERSASCTLALDDFKRAPTRQTTGASDDGMSSAMSFSMSHLGRVDADAACSEATSPWGRTASGLCCIDADTAAAATEFLALQHVHRPAVAMQPLPASAAHPHARHASHGGSSADVSVYPSRATSPQCLRLEAATPELPAVTEPLLLQEPLAPLPPLPVGLHTAQRPSMDARVTHVATSSPKPRFMVLRSWSSHPCLTALDGRILA